MEFVDEATISSVKAAAWRLKREFNKENERANFLKEIADVIPKDFLNVIFQRKKGERTFKANIGIDIQSNLFSFLQVNTNDSFLNPNTHSGCFRVQVKTLFRSRPKSRFYYHRLQVLG